MPGFINTGMTINGLPELKGYTDRFDHYETWGLLWIKEIHEITTHREHPLTFVDEQNNHWKCDFHYWTDYGSEPPPMQAIPGMDRTRHRFPFMFHDNSYQERGLWRSKDSGRTWKFVPMTRLECDQFLSIMIKYDIIPGGVFNRYNIFAGVRIGGQYAYGKGDWIKRQPKPPVGKLGSSFFVPSLS